MPKSPSPSTLKALGALSGNVCAFPGCLAPIYDTTHGQLVGRVCHIEAASEGGPRYNKNQSDEERHGIGNLIFGCSPHHDVIDDASRVDEFTVEVLKKIKHDHESILHNETMTEDVLGRLVRKVLELQTPPVPPPSLALVVESLMTRGDNQVAIDTYDFRVKLRNDGQKTVREYRIEVEIPNAYATSNSFYPAEVKPHPRGDVRLWRFTERDHPGFTLYPGDTSDYVLMLDYYLRIPQYVEITAGDIIKVLLYSGDDLLESREYRIADFLSEDRCNMLWDGEWRRPEILRGRK